MDEATARTILSLDRDLGALFEAIATIPDEALRRSLDRAVGDLMGAVARDLIFPVERLHPALRPAP